MRYDKIIVCFTRAYTGFQIGIYISYGHDGHDGRSGILKQKIMKIDFYYILI